MYDVGDDFAHYFWLELMNLEQVYLHAQKIAQAKKEISKGYEMYAKVVAGSVRLIKLPFDHPWAPGQWCFPYRISELIPEDALVWGEEYSTPLRYWFGEEPRTDGEKFDLEELKGAWSNGEIFLPTFVATKLWGQRAVRRIHSELAVLSLLSPTLPPAMHTNCYLIGDGKPTVVDPAAVDVDEQDRLLRVLRDTDVESVWLTHHHGDHIGSAQLIAKEFNVPIVAHPDSAARLSFAVETNWKSRCPIGWQCFHTPGHAPGHLVFFHERTRFLVAGDMIASLSTIVIHPDEGDMGLYLDSLRALIQLSPQAIGPAHGDLIVGGRSALEKLVGHRLAREEKVLRSLTDVPQEDKDLVTRVYSDTPTFLHPLAILSMRSHLKKLVNDNKVFCRDGRWGLSNVAGD